MQHAGQVWTDIAEDIRWVLGAVVLDDHWGVFFNDGGSSGLVGPRSARSRCIWTKE
jgi:hypothetical protein